MSSKAIRTALLAEFAKMDKAVANPLCLAGIVTMVLALALQLAHIFFDTGTYYLGICIMMLSVGLNFSARWVANRALGVLLELRGFKCGNCNTTPPPAYVANNFPLGFCPHCQLKYSVADSGTSSAFGRVVDATVP